MTVRRRGQWLVDFRRRHLLREPCCMRCHQMGRLTVGKQIDHKVALARGGKDFDEDPDNAQTLCDPCHAIKTCEDMGYKMHTACDVDGIPTEPAHHWSTD